MSLDSKDEEKALFLFILFLVIILTFFNNNLKFHFVKFFFHVISKYSLTSRAHKSMRIKKMSKYKIMIT
jgi:hypothetical protein